MTNCCRVAGFCLVTVLTLGVSQLPAAPPRPAEDSLRNTARTRIVERAERSSVNIHTEKRQKSMDVVFSAGKSTKINGMGTGIVIDERGLIVTNYHVVQDVEKLQVTTSSGREYNARVLAYDSHEDLAIIKIEPSEALEVASFGTSSDLMLGEDVIAIGNAYGYESTVTRGIISHRSRDVEVNDEQSYHNLIQIDAAINPGNSGGPLINADGEVIGINVAIRAGAQRIGFAIPIDDARHVIARLLNVERHNHTYHGLDTRDVKHGIERRLIVQGCRHDSPAAEAGVKDGDIILQVGEVKTVDTADLERSLFGRIAGASVPVLIERSGEQILLNLKLATLTGSRRTPGIANPQMASSVDTSTIVDRTWDVFGLKLEKAENAFPMGSLPYRGGMRVVDVRAASQADVNGIQKGDILVGLHIWETVNSDNIDFVLNHPQLTTMGPLKFYIVRNGETMYGNFRLNLASR